MKQEAPIRRRRTKKITVGSIEVGGDAPVVVQSMTNTDTRDVAATVRQIKQLEDAGCDVARVAVIDDTAAVSIAAIKKNINIPLIADIHFDYRLALTSMKAGADGIRINPGNMDKSDLVRVITEARARQVSIRIGVNAGSLEKDLREKYQMPCAAALVESAQRSIAFFEDNNFANLKLSLKSSDVLTTIEAYRLIARKTDYPLHLGVTEAGSLTNATIKSSIGIGMLLYEGIGSTIRVSITGDPVDEVKIAYGILRAINIRRFGVEVISCPTCGRCEIDLPPLVREVEARVANIKEDMTVALMGCVVNGIGEAGDANIGIAGGKGVGMLFKKGKAVEKVRQADFVETLMRHIEEMIKEKRT